VEQLRIPNARHQRACRQGSDPSDRLQALTRGIFAMPSVDFSLQLLDLPIERSEMLE
jgi:hypothetical protein